MIIFIKLNKFLCLSCEALNQSICFLPILSWPEPDSWVVPSRSRLASRRSRLALSRSRSASPRSQLALPKSWLAPPRFPLAPPRSYLARLWSHLAAAWFSMIQGRFFDVLESDLGTFLGNFWLDLGQSLDLFWSQIVRI